MVSVTSDIASSVSFQNTRSKSTRDDLPLDSDSFSSLVDSNTAANSARDRSVALPDAPAPAPRDDQRPAKSDDGAQRNDDRADAVAASDARNQDAQSKAASDRADAADNAKAAKAGGTDGKPDGKDVKLDKDPGKDTKDAKDSKDTKDAKTTDATATPATNDKAVPVAAVAVTVPVVTTATTDTTAAPVATNGGATQPLAIAAAVLKAQAAAAEAAAATGTSTGTEATAKSATQATTDPDFAALIAAATPAAAKTGAKQAKTATEATTTDTAVKTDKADATTAATAQTPQTASTDQKTVKDGKDDKTDAVSADGAKSDSSDAAAKPAVHVAHDRATPDASQLVPADNALPTNTSQQLLQTTAPVAAAAPQFTAALATNAPVPLDGVAVEIAQSAQSGKSRFDIRLDPAELGRIDVRLDVDRNGNVTSHLTVEKPETLAMLRQDAPQLQRALEQAGMKTSDGGLQFSLRDQSSGQSGQQNNGDNSGRQPQRLIISEDNSLPAATTAGRNYGRMLGSSRGVDISI